MTDVQDWMNKMPCICDMNSRPKGVIAWCCSSPNCKYRNSSPEKLEPDFDGDFRKYFELHDRPNTN